eukprot:831592_1
MAAKKLFKPNTKVQYQGYTLHDKVVLTNEREGIIHYIGKVKDKTGIWFGIAIINKKKGKHSGTVDDITYFTCKACRGIFVKSKQILHNKREIRSKTKAKSRSKPKRTESSPSDTKTKHKLKNRKRKTKHSKMISISDMNTQHRKKKKGAIQKKATNAVTHSVKKHKSMAKIVSKTQTISTQSTKKLKLYGDMDAYVTTFGCDDAQQCDQECDDPIAGCVVVKRLVVAVMYYGQLNVQNSADSQAIFMAFINEVYKD